MKAKIQKFRVNTTWGHNHKDIVESREVGGIV